jgi:hypothetical protein
MNTKELKKRQESDLKMGKISAVRSEGRWRLKAGRCIALSVPPFSTEEEAWGWLLREHGMKRVFPAFFTIRKYRGDDAYSWAVFRKSGGGPIVTGCGKREAENYRDRFQREEEAKS